MNATPRFLLLAALTALPAAGLLTACGAKGPLFLPPPPPPEEEAPPAAPSSDPAADEADEAGETPPSEPEPAPDVP